MEESNIPNLSYVKPDSKEALAGAQTAPFDLCVSSCSVPGAQRPEAGTLDFKVTTELGGAVTYIDNILSEEECDLLCKEIDQSPVLSFWSEAGRENKEARAFRDADTIEIKTTHIASTLWARVRHILGASRREIHIGEEEHEEDNPLWERELPGDWVPVGFNEDMLLARYPSGGAFAPHTDGRATHTFNRRSFESVIVFLNTIGSSGSSESLVAAVVDKESEDGNGEAAAAARGGVGGGGGGGGGTRFYSKEVLQQLKAQAQSQSQSGGDGGSGSSGSASRWSGSAEFVTLEVAPRAGRVLVFDQRLVHEGVPPAHPHTKYIIRSDVMYERKLPLFDSSEHVEAYATFRRAEEIAEAGDVEGSIRLFRSAIRQSPGLARMMGHA